MIIVKKPLFAFILAFVLGHGLVERAHAMGFMSEYICVDEMEKDPLNFALAAVQEHSTWKLWQVLDYNENWQKKELKKIRESISQESKLCKDNLQLLVQNEKKLITAFCSGIIGNVILFNSMLTDDGSEPGRLARNISNGYFITMGLGLVVGAPYLHYRTYARRETAQAMHKILDRYTLKKKQPNAHPH